MTSIARNACRWLRCTAVHQDGASDVDSAVTLVERDLIFCELLSTVMCSVYGTCVRFQLRYCFQVLVRVQARTCLRVVRLTVAVMSVEFDAPGIKMRGWFVAVFFFCVGLALVVRSIAQHATVVFAKTIGRFRARNLLFSCFNQQRFSSENPPSTHPLPSSMFSTLNSRNRWTVFMSTADILFSGKSTLILIVSLRASNLAAKKVCLIA